MTLKTAIALHVAASISDNESSGVITEAEALINSGLHSTEILIRVCVVLVLVCLFFIGTVITTLFARRVYKNRLDERTEALTHKFELLLTGIIFNSDEEMRDEQWEVKKEKLVRHFRKHYLKSAFNRKVFREQVLLLHKNFSGSAAAVLRNLYYELDLEKEAIRRLSSADWSEKALAVRELMQMHVVEAAPRIKKLTRDRNEILRLEAQAASIRLDEEDPFSFLDTIDIPVLDWHQLNLSHEVQRMDHDKIPDFSRWYGSQNPTVAVFAIRMSVLKNQFENMEKISLLLDHPDRRVVLEVIKALGSMEESGSVDRLVAKYGEPYTDAGMKRELLHTLGKIASASEIPFFESLMLSDNADTVFQAAMALKALGSDGSQKLEQLLNEETYGSKPLIRHVLDNRIA